VLGFFPAYTGEAVRVREQRKTVVDLRKTHLDRLVESLISPSDVHLCFVERRGREQSRIEPLSPAQLWPRLMANSVYWDESVRLAHNNEALEALLQVAGLHRLELGTDVSGMVRVVDEL
jgi:hypothetical protein